MQPTATLQPIGAPAQQPCPACQAELPLDPNYVTWCDRCGWNLRPETRSRPQTPFDALYLKLGQTLSAGMFEEVKRAADLRPRLTPTRLLALMLAALVHLSTLALLALGAALILFTWPHFLTTLLGLLCLLIVWNLRPRLGKLPDSAATPEQFPTLHMLANRIASALGAAPVDTIVIDHRFNASFGQVGLRQRQVITIGLPLFAILTPQERIAILAHEIAHGVNGDPTRGLLTWTAIQSLVQWHRLLLPDRIWEFGTRRYQRGHSLGCLLSLSGTLTNALLLGISALPRLAAYTLSHLLWRDSQRAEYLADTLAARASGTEAALGALDKLHYSSMYQRTVQQLALSQPDQQVVPLLRYNVATLPPRELERIRRIQQLDATRMDTTHPPTRYRIAQLQARPVAQPAVTLSAAEAEQLDRELMTAQQRVRRDLVDMYRSRIYY